MMDISTEVSTIGDSFRTKFMMKEVHGMLVGQALATDIPGLCQHVYFHDTWIRDDYRGQGLGNEFEAYRVNYFKDWHIYSVIKVDNRVQRHLAIKYGFNLMYEINDPYIGNALWYVRHPTVKEV